MCEKYWGNKIMNEITAINLANSNEYKDWLVKIKNKIRSAQIKAVVKVNVELLSFYWDLGADIVAKQTKAKWGEGFLAQLSKDLMLEFPDMKGFSERNIKYIRQWYLFYNKDNTIGQQPVAQIAKQHVSQLPKVSFRQQLVAQITQIPWGHNIVIISKCKSVKEAIYYVQNTITYNWSRSVLTHQIESGLYKREGRAINNFAVALPKPQSDLASQALKDPYIFDFLSMTKDYNERDLENALTTHVTQFLLELGAGFSYIGRQVLLYAGEREFFVDLLFYHTRLHCYIVIDLKTIEFEPEHAGKLNFYLKAVDAQLRSDRDNPAIGILICKKKDKVVVEYALSDIKKPIGVAEYRLMHSLPKKLQSSLPAIKDMETKFSEELKFKK